MKIVVTMMVRDEADIIAAMVEHHLGQGVDLMIVTDNGSVDGTREILADYAATGRLELHDDPVHEKQQSSVVTAMARRAFTEHGADWVINADADEFWLPVDRALTLKDALERIPTSLQTWPVPVINMTGAAARRGAGVRRLVYRDLRSDETLMAKAGLHAQPTADAIHVGSPDVEVVQGNHFVNLESAGRPAPELELEVLHLPWRSYEQYSRKVEATGLAYEASPDKRPSPRHHGMRDYRRLRAGMLPEFYAFRHPLVTEVGQDLGPDFAYDPSLVDLLSALDPVAPAHLAAALASGPADGEVSPQDHAAASELAHRVLPVELERVEAVTKLTIENKALANRAKVAERKLRRSQAARKELEARQGQGATSGARSRWSPRRLVGALRRRLRGSRAR